MTICHFIPIIKEDCQFLFLLCENENEHEWGSFSAQLLESETKYDCAIRGALEATHGTIGTLEMLRGEQYKEIVCGKKMDNYYYFMASLLKKDYVVYLNNLFQYTSKTERRPYKRARWFTIDEIFSFKHLSLELMLVLLENLNTFRNDLHLPTGSL